jgi:hypothetical protein
MVALVVCVRVIMGVLNIITTSNPIHIKIELESLKLMSMLTVQTRKSVEGVCLRGDH